MGRNVLFAYIRTATLIFQRRYSLMRQAHTKAQVLSHQIGGGLIAVAFAMILLIVASVLVIYLSMRFLSDFFMGYLRRTKDESNRG